LDLFLKAARDHEHREADKMKTPVGLVTVGLTVAILLAASLLIVTGTYGENREPVARIFSPGTK
jgi:hypothetical protein